MRHADLLREATAVIANTESAPCMILQGGTWYWCAAAWPCVFIGGMRDAIGSKNTGETFSTKFSTGGPSRYNQVFLLNPPVGILSQKTLSRKSLFSTVKESMIGLIRKKSVFNRQTRRYKEWPKQKKITKVSRTGGPTLVLVVFEGCNQ